MAAQKRKKKILQIFFAFLNKENKKAFMVAFYGWGSTGSRLEPLQGGSLLCTNKFPDVPGTLFIDLRRMKDCVDLEVTQWFRTQDPWFRNPAP